MLRRVVIRNFFRATDCGGDCGCDHCAEGNRDRMPLRSTRDTPVLSKEAAGYVYPAPDRKRCSLCVMFKPAGGACGLVQGVIKPDAVCDKFEASQRFYR